MSKEKIHKFRSKLGWVVFLGGMVANVIISWGFLFMKPVFQGDRYMLEELKTYKMFVKCDNLAQHHKKKRIRKKNFTRTVKMITKALNVVVNSGMTTEEIFTYMGLNI